MLCFIFFFFNCIYVLFNYGMKTKKIDNFIKCCSKFVLTVINKKNIKKI